MKTNTNQKVRTALKFLALALTLQALGYSTRAAVNMRDASFLGQWKDLDLLTRYYNSRSYHFGYFGYGWCTDYEKRITFTEPGKILLHDCKLSGPEEYKIPRQKAPYKRVQLKLKQDVLEFNDKGQLVAMKTSATPGLVFTYDSAGRIKAIQSSDLRRLEFEVSPQTGLIQKVVAKDGARVLSETSYEYENENLVAVKSGRLIAQSKAQVGQKNRYDNMNNLTRIDEILADGTLRTESIVYEEKLDRVKKYLAADGCQDEFSYISENIQNTSYVSVAERKCKGEIVARATYRIQNGNEKKIERAVATTERLK